MKRKIFLFNVTLLIYIANLTVSDGQVLAANLPDGVIARLSPGALVYTVAFSPDGKFLASGGDDNAVILWNVADRSERETFVEHSKSVTSVAFSPDGKLLASASLDGFVRLWHVSSEGRRTSLRHGGWVESVAFSPDEKMLVSGGGDQEGTLTLWDVPQKRDIATFSGHEGPIESVAFSPDGRIFASAARDNTIKLWNVAGQRMRKTLSGHSSVVHAVAFSPNGEILASSSRDNTIKLWQVSSGENLTTYKIENNLYVYAESVAFSPDGGLLAAACVDYTVKLWDVVNHSEVATLTGHHGGVTSVAFSPDGRTLASGSRDRTVLLWNLSYFGFEVPPIADVPEVSDPAEVAVSENPPIADLPEEPEVSDSPETEKPENTATNVQLEEPEPIVSESENLAHRQDTAPPEIVIHSPMERIVNSTVREVPVKVNVTDDSRIVDVWINDTEASVLGADVFSVTIPLNNGENVIRIIATDAHSNTGTHRFTIVREESDYIDPTPPEIVIHSPTSRLIRVNAKQFTIEGSVIDDDGIAEVWIKGAKVAVSEEGAFTTTVPLDLGDNEIRVTAMDTSGNMGTHQFTIDRNDLPLDDDTGPDIRIRYPVANVTRGVKPKIYVTEASTHVSGIVTDPSGVDEVKVNSTKVQVTEDTFSATVQLVHGDNTIRITATDTWGNQSIEKIIIFHEPYERKGKDYALLFAAHTYDHWNDLLYPLLDAKSLRTDLEDIYGFQVELIENPTEAEVLEVLDRYAQKEYAPEDQLLIFFAGHGYFNEGFKIGYLVAQDTQRPDDSGRLLSYLSHSYFRDIIDNMPCKHILLMLDTCYSGTFDEQIAMRGEGDNLPEELSSRDIRRKLKYMTRRYLASGGKEEVPDNSPFIRALLKALRSKGGNDKVLTIEEILINLKEIENPKPCSDEFGHNDPDSDFFFIAK